jgi:hypothetical protein
MVEFLCLWFWSRSMYEIVNSTCWIFDIGYILQKQVVVRCWTICGNMWEQHHVGPNFALFLRAISLESYLWKSCVFACESHWCSWILFIEIIDALHISFQSTNVLWWDIISSFLFGWLCVQQEWFIFFHFCWHHFGKFFIIFFDIVLLFSCYFVLHSFFLFWVLFVWNLLVIFLLR